MQEIDLKPNQLKAGIMNTLPRLHFRDMRSDSYYMNVITDNAEDKRDGVMEGNTELIPVKIKLQIEPEVCTWIKQFLTIDKNSERYYVIIVDTQSYFTCLFLVFPFPFLLFSLSSLRIKLQLLLLYSSYLYAKCNDKMN